MAEKAVIMTGTADGLGRAASIAAARAGYAVLLVDIDESKLAETARLVKEAGGDAVIAKADVSNEDDVVAYVAKAVAALDGSTGFSTMPAFRAPSGRS